jgi:hypothetical protein
VPNLIVSAVSTFDNKGLKKGQKEISAFDKSVKSLGKTFASVFALGAITNFSKNAVKAFAADEAAAKALEVQLNNTGYAFSAPGIELYIANLQKATGVLDDQLRPALQTILTASGSLTQSQKALAIALDIAAGTGKSVVEVSAAIAKGYTGQTTALSRLGAGISKTTLASGDMNKILDEASGKFSGQALARLDTYAGKMDVLKTSTANATETIGKGLLDSLSMLGKDQNIATLGTSMEKVATTIANVVVGLGSILGRVISIGQAIFSKLHLDKVIGFLYNNSLIAKLASFGASEATKPKSNFTYGLGSSAGADIARATEVVAIKKAAAARKEELRLLGIKNGIENKNVEELKKKFDLERIGLSAALNSATDEETKLRLRAQLAILDNNEALAKKLLAEMEAAEALKKLAEAAKIASDGLTSAFGQLAKATKDLLLSFGLSPEQVGPGGTILTADKGITGKAGLQGLSPNNPLFFTSPETTNLGLALGFTPGVQRASATEPMDIRLTIDGGSDKLSQAIAESIQLATRSGYNTVPAGFLV